MLQRLKRLSPPRFYCWGQFRYYDQVLGINARNAHIAGENHLSAIRLVKDKYLTKLVLAAHGVPVAETLLFIDSRPQLKHVDWTGLPDTWALKPNQGGMGNGILLAFGRNNSTWLDSGGKPLPLSRVRKHAREVIDGEHSGRLRDQVLFEPLIVSHPDVQRLSYKGLPDIRVVCSGSEPVLSMIRIPTKKSGGRANLHQGAIGAAVDLATGRITRAWLGRHPIRHHPDNGERLIDAQIPAWDVVLNAASRCSAATGLNYLGADIVVDQSQGPLLLEVNARPGLQIQNVTGTGLAPVVEANAWSSYEHDSLVADREFTPLDRRTLQIGGAAACR